LEPELFWGAGAEYWGAPAGGVGVGGVVDMGSPFFFLGKNVTLATDEVRVG